LNKVDPRLDSCARNLLSIDLCRAALRNEPVPEGPKVPLVSKSKSCACRAERLARTGTSPNRSVVGPSSEPKRERPSTDSGEEVALCIASQVIRSDISNISLINVAGGNVAGGNQVTQLLRGVTVVLVVVGTGHWNLGKKQGAVLAAPSNAPRRDWRCP
jgi:hypothetical protein